jgi:hypothetical protein
VFPHAWPFEEIAMATVKNGQFTATKEWARHLRPFIKRMFWKAERRAARQCAQQRSQRDA